MSSDILFKKKMSYFNPESKVWEAPKVSYPFTLDTFMGDEILKKLKETPKRVVQIFHDESTELTCDELSLKSIRVAQNLTKFGVKADDVVGIICSHSHQLTFLLTACILIGAPVNPLDLFLSKYDIKHMFRQTVPKIVVCDLKVSQKVQEALNELNSEAKIFVMKEEMADGASSFSALTVLTRIEADFIAPKFNTSADEKILAILPSSGTTGLSKGVILTHAQCLMWTPLLDLASSSASRSLGFSPFFWGSGFYPHMLLAFTRNKTCILTCQDFSIEALTDIVQKHKVTHLTAPPSQLTSILNSEFVNSDHKCLKTINCTGSIVSESLRQKFLKHFPDKDMAITYGMTEVGVATTSPGDYKEKLAVGSIIFVNVSVKIVNENDQKLGIGEVGEIYALPPRKFRVRQ